VALGAACLPGRLSIALAALFSGTTSCLSLRVNLASWLGKVSLRRNQIIHTSGEKFLAGNET